LSCRPESPAWCAVTEHQAHYGLDVAGERTPSGINSNQVLAFQFIDGSAGSVFSHVKQFHQLGAAGDSLARSQFAGLDAMTQPRGDDAIVNRRQQI
jgi:hypothetical protein